MDNSELYTDNGSTTATESAKIDTSKKKHRKRKKDKTGASDSDMEAQYENIKLKAIIDQLTKDREICYARIKELELTLKSYIEKSEFNKIKNNNLPPNNDQPPINIQSHNINPPPNNIQPPINIQPPNNNQPPNTAVASTVNTSNDVVNPNEMETNDWAAEIFPEGNLPNTTAIMDKIPAINRGNVKIHQNRHVETTNNLNSGKASPPTIKIYNTNVKQLTVKLKEKLKHDLFTINILNGKNIQLKLKKLEDFIATREMLDNENINYFTYTPNELKPRTLLVKGLSETYDVEDLKDFIKTKNLPLDIKSIIKLKGGRWVLQLGRASDLSAFKKLQFLINSKVKIEKYKTQGIILCRNCQRPGHISTNCKMPYRCFKCPEAHERGKCKIPPKELNIEEHVSQDPKTGKIIKTIGIPVYCVNCKTTGHVASAKNCPYKIQLLEKLKETRELRKNSINPKTLTAQNSIITSQVGSYANALKINLKAPNELPPQKTQSADFMKMFDTDCKRLLGKDFFTCLKKIGEHVESYKQLKTDAERTQSLYQLFVSLKLDD